MTDLRKDQARRERVGERVQGRVRGQNLDATTEENGKIVHALGFGSHGIVIRSVDGKTLWKQPDHEVKIEDVRRELDRLLSK